jgi:hypothetical protein
MAQQSNKVLRDERYKNHSADFLRVNFVNEHLQKGYYSGKRYLYKLGHIHQIMSQGFYFSDQKYHFLSYTNSQLSTHSTWFLKKDNTRNFSNESIIEGFGNFN